MGGAHYNVFVEYLEGFSFLFSLFLFMRSCKIGVCAHGCMPKRQLFLKMAVLSGHELRLAGACDKHRVIGSNLLSSPLQG